MKRKILAVCILLVLIIITTILAISVNESKDNKFNIATSFYPMYIAVLNITDGVQGVNVTNLTSNQVGCIHDYVLTTTELVTLAKADALVINGAGMEGYMDKVISNFKNLETIDSSEGIDIIEACNLNHKGHEGHEHNENSHIFVSVKNYMKQVKNICNGLIKIDEANKEKYIYNTENYIKKLQELDEEITKAISNFKFTSIVTFNNTLAYFAKDYGLNIVEMLEKEHGKSPSASEIAHAIDVIKSNGVVAIFVEPEESIKLVNTVSKETGVKTYELNPVTFGENNKDEYINIMKMNLNVLKEALG